MKILYCLLLAICLFSEVFSGMSLTSVGQRSDHYICAKRGGTCNYSPCPRGTKISGSCYNGKAKCCLR